MTKNKFVQRHAFIAEGRAFFLLAILAILILVTQTAFAQANSTKGAPSPKNVLVLSIDGLDARYIRNRDSLGLKIPTLRRLIASGATASGVTGVYPTLTYPSHTSLMTGVLPIRHGIFGNNEPGPGDAAGNINGIWFAREIKADTLWDAAKRAGLKVGLVSWPVGGGVGDFNFPEIWKPGGKREDNRRVISENSLPRGLLENIERADPELYAKMTDDEGDDTRSRAAAYIVQEYGPELMLVHLFDLDHWEHSKGPFTPEAIAILEKTDAYLARILAAYEKRGNTEPPTVFIVSDHGFQPISKSIKPGVLLAKNGLIDIEETTNAEGKKVVSVKDWRALPYVTGGSCAILLRDPKDEETRLKVMRIFKPLEQRSDSGIFAVFDRPQIRTLGANPEAAIMLEAADSYSFASGLTGDVIESTKSKGTHGYLPTRYQTSFIANGPRIKSGINIGHVRMTDIGPTIASVLGLKLTDATGMPLVRVKR